MTWLQRYRIRSYLRRSIWILPAVGMLAAFGIVRVVSRTAIRAAMTRKYNIEF